MACDKSFSSSYMLLKPEEVGLFDLLRILFSSDIQKRKFVDSSEKEGRTFGLRWIIFISIVLQKCLLFVAKPLSIFGSAFELFLNLVSSNGSFAELLLKIIRGKVVMPDKNSASFISFIGNLDKRMELDRSIKHGDERYYWALSMMASKAAYENKAYVENIVKNHWKMEFLGSYDYWNDFQGKATTQAFVLNDKKDDEEDTIVVSFRGTEPFDADAWCTDVDLSWYEIHGMGKIHGGFMKALGLQKCIGWPKQIEDQDSGHRRPAPLAYYAIRDMLRQLLSKNDRAKYIVTGHSLGGALAILFPAILAFHEETLLLERLEGVYTFGQPRVGDDKFVGFMQKKLKDHGVKYFRFVYCNDLVPRLPFDDSEFMFKHFGNCFYFNRFYQGKVVLEEPHKNYFSSLLATVTMRINAILELVRSFTLAWKKGPDYTETWLLITQRVIGLIVPGIPNHSPYDYVNSTRLGFLHAFCHHKSA